MQKFKKPTLLLSLCALALLPLTLVAQDNRPIHVNVNNEPVLFKGMTPQQIQGRVMIPVRGVLEKLGAQVTWVAKTQEVVANNGKVDITLKIGSRQARINGKDVPLDVPAQIISGATMVPLRFVGEAMGADIKWDGATRTVHIATAGGSAPTPAPTPVALDSITLNAADTQGWLHAGSSVVITLKGTPGGQASFRIPGLVEEVELKETSAGEYTGAWVVPDKKPIQVTNARVLGTLKKGKETAPLLQSSETLRVDTLLPTIRDRSPEDASKISVTRPNIYAVFEDQGSGINSASIKLMLDGKNVTTTANVTKNFISLIPTTALKAGVHNVELTVADNAGNSSTVKWQFTLDATSAAGIRTVTHNADKTLEPGDTLHVKVVGTPKSKVTFSVGNIKDVKVPETTAGTYETDYTVRKGDDTSGSKLSVKLVTDKGELFSQDATRAVAVKTGKPTAPKILYPEAKENPPSKLIIRGTATPNTDVKLRIEYRGKLGGLIGVKGTALDTVVRADKNGVWETPEVNLRGVGSGVEYTLTAVSANASGEESETTTMTFKTR
jgi:hypothetical protein